MGKNTSLLRLDTCILKGIAFRLSQQTVNNALDPNPKSAAGDADNISITFGIRRHKAEPKFWISYGLKGEWPDRTSSRFEKLQIELEGVFSFEPGTQEETIKQYVPVLCLTNLHGIARGTLLQITGTCPGGPYCLPLVDMNKIVNEARSLPTPQPPDHFPPADKGRESPSTRKRTPRTRKGVN